MFGVSNQRPRIYPEGSWQEEDRDSFFARAKEPWDGALRDDINWHLGQVEMVESLGTKSDFQIRLDGETVLIGPWFLMNNFWGGTFVGVDLIDAIKASISQIADYCPNSLSQDTQKRVYAYLLDQIIVALTKERRSLDEPIPN